MALCIIILEKPELQVVTLGFDCSLGRLVKKLNAALRDKHYPFLNSARRVLRMNSARPIWIEDYVITKKILLGFIKKCSNGVARPSFVITERSIPELFDYNNVDTEFLWSLIEILQNEFDVVEIRLQNVKVHEPVYLKAKLFFKSESLTMLHDWFSEELKPKQVKDVDFYSSNAWKRLRFKAFELHGNICQCCGARPPGVVLEVDHIKPRSIYPELALELDNLQILCRACNSGKSNRYDSDFRGAS